MTKRTNLVLGMLLIMLLAMSTSLMATTYTITTTSDVDAADGTLTLREAIIAANTDGAYNDALAGSGNDIINITATGTINLNSALTISSNITITGPGSTASQLIIDASGISGDRRIFQITSGTVKISLLALTGAFLNGTACMSTNDGGAFYLTGGNITIEDCYIYGNTHGGANSGDCTGGTGVFIGSGVNATLRRCCISNNTADAAPAVLNKGTTLLENCTIDGNSSTWGGAITNEGTNTLTINSCTISDNIANNDAGGLSVFAGTAKYENTIIFGNTSPQTEKMGGTLTSIGNNITTDPGFIGSLDTGYAQGGKTPTRPLSSGGAARNGANNATDPGEDQRAYTRDATPDIGAFDYDGSSSTAPEMALKQSTTSIADGGSHDFGSHATGTNTDVIFTIENNGDADLAFPTPITIGGANANQFSIQQQPSSPVSGSGNTTFKIRFSPTSTGAKTATISIANNDGDENPYDLTITGTGTAPEMALSQGATPIADGGSQDCGNQIVGTNTDLVFTITNYGNTNLTLTTPIVLGGTNPGDFSIQTQPSSPLTSGGGTTTFTVRFTPTTTGARSATIAIANNDSDENPYNLTITGTGTKPIMVLSQGGTQIPNGGSHGFGNQLLGTNTDLVFVITNMGNANLTLTTPLTPSGTDPGQFSIQAQPSSPVASGGGSTTFTVRFTPISAGTKTATIAITNSDSDENPYILIITGTGTDPIIYYMTKNSGNWSSNSIWFTNSSGGTNPGDYTTAATETPNASNSNGIIVNADVTVTSDITIDQCTINNGVILFVNNGVTFTVDDGTGDDLTVEGTGTIDVNGQLSASAAQIVYSGAGYLNFTQSSFSVNSFTAGSSTVTFDGADQNVPALTYYNLTTSGFGTKTLTGAIDINGNLTTGSGTTLNSGSGYSINLAGTWSNSGTFAANSGTVIFDGANQNVPALTYYNLTTSGIGTKALTGAIDINGNLTIESGTTLNTSAGYSINLAGNWSNNGTFTPNASTVTFNASSGQTIAGWNTFNNLTINNSHASEKVTASGTLVVSNNLLVTDGIFVSASDYKNVTIGADGTLELSGDITVSGNWSNAGTFNANSGTVTFDGASQTLIGITSFYNLTKNVTSAATLTFPDGNTTTVSNTLNLSGASGQLLSLRSSSGGTQWNLDPQGTRTLSYLDVKDSKNNNATDIDVVGDNCTDSGNNSDWVFSYFSGGDGTEGAPYQIANLNDLQFLSETSDKWDKYYIQTANINASATSGWNGGAGFSPIGSGSSFTGSYDGNDKTINGLYINRSGENFIGLFGYTNNATVQDLGMTNVNITGNQTTSGLVAKNDGTSTVTNCYSSGSVSGYRYVGGLVGENTNNASVSNCYSNCSVSGSNYQIGGLVGYNRGTVSNCYATGNISGGNEVGGLVGLSGSSGSVVYSYSTGSVSGNSSLGGLIGSNWGQPVTNCFWDTQTSGQSTSAGGTGKTTAEMKTHATFIDAGWDFMDETTNGSNDYWGLNQNENGSYPFLEWQGYANVVPPEINLKQGSTNIADGGSYDFGNHVRNTNSDVIFTIENTGNGDLTLSGSPIISISGTNADQFSVQQQPSSPVSGYGNTTFKIRFSPTSTGSKTATISIANNDVDENPYDLTINGTGTAPEMAFSQGATPIADGGSQDFGSQLLGTNTDLVFTITNSGTANLTLTTPLTLGGTDPGQFSIQAQPSSPVASGGGTTTFTVRFTPTSEGAKSATIAIANNDGDENPYNLTITGTGTAPEMALSQGATPIADGDSQDFGNQLLGTNTDLVFTITNSGTANLTLTTPLTLGGTDPGQFSIQAQPSSPVASGGGTTTFTVRFTPTSAGAKSATIAIANSDSDENPYNLTITGTGTDSEMALSQGATPIADGGSQDFGSQLLGTNTDLVYTITNSGTSNLTLTTPLTLGGTDPGQFSIQAQPSSPVASGGGTTTFTVRFTPTSTGAKSASITIANNDGDENPYNLTITGTGTTPEMDLKQAATPIADGGNYDFDEQASGSDTDVTFTIENTGTANLTMDGTPIITITGPNSDQFSVQVQPNSSVTPSGSTSFVIRFSPTSSGAKTATISIANNDTDENPYDLTLTGTGKNTQPTATNTTQTQTYTEGDVSVAIDDIVVTDPDVAEQITATLTLSNTETGELTANSGNGEIYSSTTGVWTVTESVVNVNAALAAMAFEPETNNDVDATIVVDIRDGQEDGATAVTGTITLDVTAVNDPPTISEIEDQTTDEDTPTSAIPFTVDDVEMDAATLTVTGSSNNQILAPDANIAISGTGRNRTVKVTPAPNQSGEAAITITVSDGDEDTDETFVLKVKGANDPPVISDIADQVTDEDTPSAVIPFTISDLETDADDLEITAWTRELDLYINENIVLGGSGTNRTVQVTPNPNQFGKGSIVIRVEDGEEKVWRSFALTVNPVNDAPTISDIVDQTTIEDTPTEAIPFLIGDIETEPAELVVSAVSDNKVLIPDGNITLGGSGAERSVVLTPADNQTGAATVTITVSDGEAQASDTFVLNVGEVNDPPTISDIADQTTNEDTPTEAIPFFVGDIETDPAELVVSAVSDNKVLLPDGNITLGGSSAERSVILIPAENQTGTATVTVTVSDDEAQASDTFVLTVKGVNDAPMISDITDKTTNEDTPTEAIPFTVGDVETDPADLLVSSVSNNKVLLPDGNITLGGSGNERTVVLSPADNQTGTATITITVSDGEAQASETFVLTVKDVNDPPTISDIADQATLEDTPTEAIPFTVGDVETDPVDLLVSSVSDNKVLLPVGNIVLGGSGNERTVVLSPADNQTGTATVTVTVSDGEAQASDTFVLTVKDVNDPPTISDIADQATLEDTPTEAIPFAVGDNETDPDEFVVSAVADNKVLLPDGNITLGGTGNERTVVLSPADNQTGTAAVTVTVSDGEAQASDTFVLYVEGVNDPPVITELPKITFDEDDSTWFDLDLFVTDLDNDTSEISWIVEILSDSVPVPAYLSNAEATSMKPLGELIFISIDDSTHIATFKAETDFNYVDAELMFIAKDPEGKGCNDTTMLSINAVNDTPRFIISFPPIDLVQGVNYSISRSMLDMLVHDVDNPDSTLNWLIEDHPHLSPKVSTDSISFLPSFEWFGTDTLTVTISDGELSDQAPLVVTVHIPLDEKPPTVPINFAAVSNHNCIDLCWDVNSEDDVFAYNIYRTTDSTDVTIEDIIATVSHPLTAFNDSTVEMETEYYYWLTAVDTAANESDFSKMCSVKLTTGVNERLSIIPDKFELSQNYPNPFNPSTTIKYALPEKSHVIITIYNIMGQEVAKLMDEEMEPGYHSIHWDAKETQSGIYIYRIQAGEFMNVKKCLMIK